MPSRLDHGSGAFAVLEGMKEEALKPNLFTFNRLRDSGQTEMRESGQRPCLPLSMSVQTLANVPIPSTSLGDRAFIH